MSQQLIPQLILAFLIHLWLNFLLLILRRLGLKLLKRWHLYLLLLVAHNIAGNEGNLSIGHSFNNLFVYHTIKL